MNQAHVKVLPFFKQWAIEVNKIYIESFVIEEHYLAIFSSDYQLVILSDDLFSILSGIYFQYNECDIINDIINCKQSILSIINISINFEIGDSLLHLDTKTIFPDCNENGFCSSIFKQSISEKKHIKRIIFGTFLLENSIVSFDYEQKEIAIYSDTKIISKANPNRDIISQLCLLNSSLMLMLIFTYIIIYNTQNNLNNFIVPNI